MYNQEESILPLIMHAGTAKSSAFEALESADESDFSRSYELIKQARAEINLAHKAQTSLMQMEANEEKLDISMILIHAQDHLMTAMLAIDLIEKMIVMKEEIKQLKEQ